MNPEPQARCVQCDEAREQEGTPWLIGQPCDICDGRTFDYLGRPCRHCAQKAMLR